MKQLCLIALAVVSLLIFQSAHAQDLSKEELKEWKKKQKSMDPLEFKTIFEEYGKLQGASSKQNRNRNALKKEIDQKSKQIASRDETLEELSTKYKELQETCGDMDVSPLGEDFSKGVVFKVQIGAFAKIDLSEFADVTGNFGIENKEGVNKYTIAYFRDYKEAHVFKKYMRAMGIPDAWVVVYEDNIRKNINDFIPKDQSLEEN